MWVFPLDESHFDAVRRCRPVRQQGELVGTTQLRSSRTDFLYVNANDLIQNGGIYITVASLSLVSFRHFSVLDQGRLTLHQYISSFREPNISYHFFSSLSATWVLPLEVKYDIFRNGDEGTWQKHLEWYSQHTIVDPHPSSMSQASLETEKAFTVKEHKHTQTYTHANAN